MALTHLWQIDI